MSRRYRRLTEESTSGQDRGDQGLVTGRNDKVLGGGVVRKTGKSVDGILHAHDTAMMMSVGLIDERHACNLRDPANIVTEVDTSEGSKSTHHVGFCRDGSFDAIDIGGATENRGSHLD
jgi:hypothetical protein